MAKRSSNVLGTAQGQVRIDTTPAQQSIKTLRKQATDLEKALARIVDTQKKLTRGAENVANRQLIEQQRIASREAIALEKVAMQERNNLRRQATQQAVALERMAAKQALDQQKIASKERIALERLAAKQAVDARKQEANEILALERLALKESATLRKQESQNAIAQQRIATKQASDLRKQELAEAKAGAKLVADIQKQGAREIAAAQKQAAREAQAAAKAAQTPKQPTSLPEFKSFAAAQKQAAREAAAVERQAAKERVAQQRQAAREAVEAERALGKQVVDQRKRTASELANYGAQIAAQQARFNNAVATAPSSVDRSGTRDALSTQRATLARLRQEMASITSKMSGLPAQEAAKYIPQLRALEQQARKAATNGIEPLTQSVNNFNNTVQRSRQGLSGYFNQVRENLERLNQTSLSANLQEISFRMLPVTLAAGATVRQGFDRSNALEEARLAFTAITGSQEKAIQLQQRLTKEAQRYGLPVLDVMTTMQRFIPVIEQSGSSIEETMNLAARLMTLNPAQGFEGALFSITEAMSSGEGGLDAISLRERFGIIPSQLRAAREETGSLTAALDLVLNRMSRTTELAEQFGNSNRASLTRATDAWNNLLATALAPVANVFADAADLASRFFNALNDVSPALAQVAGGVLAVVAAAGSALVVVGQLAIAISALKALAPVNIPVNVGGNTAAGVVGSLVGGNAANTASQLAGGAAANATGAAAARAGIGGMARNALGTAGGFARNALGVAGRIAAPALAVTGGVYAASHVATGLGITDSPEQAIERIVQMLLAPTALLTGAFEFAAVTIQNFLGSLGTHLQNFGVTVDANISWVGDILQKFGGALNLAIAELQVFTGNLAISIASLGERFGIDLSGIGQWGLESLSAGLQRRTEANYAINRPILNVAERTAGRYQDGGNILPSETQWAEIQNNTARRWVEMVDGILVNLFGRDSLLPPPVEDTVSDGVSFGSGRSSNNILDADNLEKAYGLLVNNMIQESRRAQDEAIAAARELEDFSRTRSRTIEDFNRQLSQSQEDFDRSQLERAQSYQEELAQEEERNRKSRLDQAEKYYKDEQRAREDHLLSMSRMSRDVDQALSGRNFLEAQNAVQRMNDAEEDYQIERKRRQEDYKEQEKDLDESIAEQQKKRDEAYKKQTRDAEEQFQRQRQRQIEEFNQRLAREDQDRALRQQREAQDRDLRRQRENDDLNMQIWSLTNHSFLMQGIWNNGLSSMRATTEAFWQQMRNADATFKWGGAPVGGGGGMPAYITPYDTGAWNILRDQPAYLHEGEMVVPAETARMIRGGAASIGGGGGGVSITIDARGSTMSAAEFKRMSEIYIVPEVTRAMRDGAKGKSAWR